MDITNSLSEGLQMMLVGMTMVFVFLSALVMLINLMKFAFAEPEQTASQSDALKSDVPTADEIVAISSAVHRFRQNHKE